VASFARSKQPPVPPAIGGQSVWPVPHWHWPETHVPSPQLRLQLPQWLGSLEVSKQPVGHDTSLPGHWQTLFTQVSPGLHVTIPHVTGGEPLELDVEAVPVDVDVDVDVDAVPVDVEAVVEPPAPGDPLEVEAGVPVEVEGDPVEVDGVPVDADAAPAPVVSMVVPPQPAWVSTAEPARMSVIDAALRSEAMKVPPFECRSRPRCGREHEPIRGHIRERELSRQEKGGLRETCMNALG
jgi:hypothetical protein